MIEHIDKHATAKHIDMYAKLLTMGDYRSGMMKAKEILLNQEEEDIAPTAPKIIRGADIVQVCRCKDCAYCDWDVIDVPYGITEKVWWCNKLCAEANENLIVEPDDFCSFAKRRE